MSVIGQAQELPQSQGGDAIGETGRLRTTHTRSFQVRVTSNDDNEMTVLRAPGLPFLYQPFQTTAGVDLFSLATGFRASRVTGNRKRWIVNVTYSHFDSEEKEETKDPTVRRPIVSWDTEEIQRPMTQWKEVLDPELLDLFGILEAVKVESRYTSSAGEVFSPPPMETIYRELVTFTYGSPFFDNDIAIDYSGAINSDLFFRRQPKTAKVRKIRTPGVKAWTGQNREILYFPITVVIVFAEKGQTWKRTHLDFGTYEIRDDGKKYKITDEPGNPIQGRLNGAGGKLADADPDEFVDLRPPIALPFSKLALPGSQPGGVGGA